MARAAALTSLLLASLASAHMSIWTPAMYGVDPGFQYDENSYGNPVVPLGPGWTDQDSWWFRGPEVRAKPPLGAPLDLPAGGSVQMDIACHVAWSDVGWRTTVPGSHLDACPSGAGAYHTSDTDTENVHPENLGACALAIADVDEIGKVTWDNLVIFSVKKDCVQWRHTDFEIPAKMPKCTGDKCICGWFWEPLLGQANFYMTAFDCTVSGSPEDATPIAAPSDPVFCLDDPDSCTKGAKRPIYAYNEPTNVPWIGNEHRATYFPEWSFSEGAQNDIFVGASANASSSSSASAASSSTVASSSVVSSSVASSSSSASVTSTSSSSSSSSVASTSSEPTSSSSSSSSEPTSSATSSSSSSSVAPSSSTEDDETSSESTSSTSAKMNPTAAARARVVWSPAMARAAAAKKQAQPQ